MKKLLEVMQKIEKNLEQLQNNCTSKSRQTNQGKHILSKQPKQMIYYAEHDNNVGQQHSHGLQLSVLDVANQGTMPEIVTFQ